jgi:hypothetical protein
LLRKIIIYYKNMKKYGFLVVILFITVVSLAGCAKTQNNSNNKDADSQAKKEFGRRPDFGQPETPADVTGIVKSIIGNEVTILKIERPNRTDQASTDEAGVKNQEKQQSVPAVGGVVPGTGRGGFGGMRGGNVDADTQARMLERMKEMSTGEAKVIIPVGIRMLMPEMTDGTSEPTVKEATLVDVKADKMLQIWLNKEVTDRQVADFVLIMR